MNRPLFVGSYLQARGGLSANEKEEKVYQGWFLVSLMLTKLDKIKIIFQFVKCGKTNSTL